MNDDLKPLQAEVTRLQRIVETNAVTAAQARSNLESDLRHLFDGFEVQQAEALASVRCQAAGATHGLRQELSTRIQAEGERVDAARQDLRNDLTTRMVDVSVQLRKVIDALADKTDAEIAALSGRVDLNCAGC